MSNFLTRQTLTVALPDDLDWPDEFSWSPAALQKSRSVTGALLLDEGLNVAGREITLQGGTTESGADFGAMTRAMFEQIYTWQYAPENMELDFRGVVRTVRFDFSRGAGAEARPVHPVSDPIGSDFVVPIFRFVEV